MSGEARPDAWDITVHVLDLGQWLPDDERQAADLIAAVNAWRTSDNPKPKIRRNRDGRVCLEVHIGRTSLWLRPGDHLVRCDMPQVTTWDCPSPEELAELFPEEWPS